MPKNFNQILLEANIQPFPAGFIAWLPVQPNNLDDYIDELDAYGWILCNGVAKEVSQEKYPQFYKNFSDQLENGTGELDPNKKYFYTPDLTDGKTVIGSDGSASSQLGTNTSGGVLPKIYGTFPTYHRYAWSNSRHDAMVSGAFSDDYLFTTPAEHKHVGYSAAKITFDSSKCSSVYSGTGDSAEKVVPYAIRALPFMFFC